jgi:hypothetical protein
MVGMGRKKGISNGGLVLIEKLVIFFIVGVGLFL